MPKSCQSTRNGLRKQGPRWTVYFAIETKKCKFVAFEPRPTLSHSLAAITNIRIQLSSSECRLGEATIFSKGETGYREANHQHHERHRSSFHKLCGNVSQRLRRADGGYRRTGYHWCVSEALNYLGEGSFSMICRVVELLTNPKRQWRSCEQPCYTHICYSYTLIVLAGVGSQVSVIDKDTHRLVLGLVQGTTYVVSSSLSTTF